MFLGNLLHMYQIYIKNSNVQKIVVKILVLDSYYTNYTFHIHMKQWSNQEDQKYPWEQDSLS